MLSRIVAILVATGFVAIVLVSNNADQQNLRRRLQQVGYQNWGPSPGGFQSVQQQNGGGFMGPPGGGFDRPAPQMQQVQGFGAEQGFAGASFSQQQGFGGGQSIRGPHLRQGEFGGSSPQQVGGFGGDLPQQQQGFGGFPPQQQGGFGGLPPEQQQGFGGLPPQQQGGFGGLPPQQQGGFGGLPPEQQQGFGGLPSQQQGGFGGPPPEQQQGFGGPRAQQQQGFGGLQPPNQDGPNRAPRQGQEGSKKAPLSPQGGKQQQQQGSGKCSFREPSKVKVTPTWTASFPGSGGKLLWQTIEQLTGIITSDDNDSNGSLKAGSCVSVKTHYPSKHVSPKFFIMDTSAITHAILLIRNPLDVLPSYFKFLYRMQEANVNAEPSVDRWVRWRNENFDDQLSKWVEHTKLWMTNYQNTGKLMILPFEHFTDPKVGPEALKALGIFLSSVDPTISQSLTSDNNLGCFWNMMVGDSAPGQAKGKKKRIVADSFQGYPYTLANLDSLVKELKNLKAEYAAVPQLANILNDYVKKVVVAKRKIEQILAA